jgi:hypothetical protein
VPAHPSKDIRCAEQQQRRECRRKAKGQNESVKGKRIGDVARLPAPSARAIADDTPPPMPLAAVC